MPLCPNVMKCHSASNGDDKLLKTTPDADSTSLWVSTAAGVFVQTYTHTHTHTHTLHSYRNRESWKMDTCCCLLFAWRLSNHSVYLRDRSSLTTVQVANLRQKLHIKRGISARNRTLTPGEPVFRRHAPGRAPTRVPMLSQLA